MTSFKNTLLPLALSLLLAACDGSDSAPPADTGTSVDTPTTPAPDPDPAPVATGPSQLFLLADGITLRAMSATDAGLTELGNASIPVGDLLPNHQIFGLAVHPNRRWVYAASEIEQNWGNARISRFEIDWDTGKLSFVDSFLLAPGSGPGCGDGDECAPVGLGITPDGSRLIVEENDYDTFLTFAIAADGSLAFLNSAADNITRYHGVGINADGTYLYQGSKAFSRTGDTITDLANADGAVGNATVVLRYAGVDRLYTTVDINGVGVFDLTDPAAPVRIAQINPDAAGGVSKAIFLAVTGDGSRLLAVGDGSVALIDFDGTALTRRSQLTLSPTRKARGAAFNGDGTMAVVSFQTNGAKLYRVGTDGSLTETGSYPSFDSTRAVVFAARP
ncbi:MAG: hypothetical protein ACTHL1_13965 [Burkholderiaceae bacterium]